MTENIEKNPEYWMRQALALAEKAAAANEVPVGAIVVKEGQVIGRGFNRKEALTSATRHAEIEAIEDASKNLGAWRLNGCDLYVTLEPCPMCAGAIIQSRIRHLYYGADDPKGGAVKSLYRLLDDERWNHRTLVTAAILSEPCSSILTDFFKKRREKRRAVR